MAAVEFMCGPWPLGTSRPNNWTVELGPGGGTLKELLIWGGHIVHGVGFGIADAQGKVTMELFGGTSSIRSPGTYNVWITLAPGEYLTQISGSYGFYAPTRHRQISSLCMHTNIQPDGYGPFGYAHTGYLPTSFQSAVYTDYPVVRLFGSASENLDSIGAYARWRQV